MSDFSTEREIKARTTHACDESGCRRTREIKPGTRYVRIAGCYDGHFYVDIYCLRCRRARRRAWQRYRWHAEEGPPLGELLCWLREARLHRDPEPVRRLRGARA